MSQSPFNIRPFHPADIPDMYHICLATGDSGKSAEGQYSDSHLLGQFYMAPYVHFDPKVCFVLTKNHRPVGYVIGTQDSENFEDFCNNKWLPPLRERYPMPDERDQSKDAQIIKKIHEGYHLRDAFRPYPAHLHIDILPAGQRKGFGRTLMETFIDRLEFLKCRGLHLEVGKKNPVAIRFYERFGLSRISDFSYSVGFGLKLPCTC